MPKLYSHTVSVVKDSTKVIGCSESDIELCRVGSYLRTKNHRIIYEVVKVTPVMLIHDFVIANPKHIRIEDDTKRRFLKEDVVDLSFKEYELGAIFEVISGGERYRVEDVLSPASGSASFDISHGISRPAEVVVNGVDEHGKITSIGLKQNGLYTVCPEADCEFKGGAGKGAKFRCEFDLVAKRQIIEKTIQMSVYENGITNLFLDYPLPANVKEGKISCQKVELTIDKPYVGETDFASEYELLHDFTPNLSLPLCGQATIHFALASNKAFMILDSKIKELEDRIRSLEGSTGSGA